MGKCIDCTINCRSDMLGYWRAILLSIALLLYGCATISHGAQEGGPLCAGVRVTVGGGDQARDCSNEKGSLANFTCNSLQDVLLSVSENRTLSGDSGQFSSCVEVRLLPGVYVISEVIRIVGQSLVIWGDGTGVTVTFNFSDTFDPTLTHSPFYVLSFTDCDVIEIRNVAFSQSPGIITTVNVDSVLVKECSFRYFFQGAVDIYNCPSVTVQDSLFEHNGPVSVFKPEPYRGHSGGLSIGYYEEVSVVGGPSALVSNCTFRNNTSDPRSVVVQSTSELFQRFAFTGRGGGCAFTIAPSTSLNAIVENSTIEDNFARSFGGGLYVGFNGYLNHTVTVNRVRLIRNQCPGAAGGLEIGFVQGADPYSLNRIMVYNSEFIENRASFGGGVYFFSPGPTGPDGRLSNFGHFENCTFTGNTAREYGAAIGAITLLYFQDMVNLIPLEVESCTFVGNDDGGGGGVLSTAYLPVSFSGHTIFMQNRGRTLVILGAHIEIRGGMHFSNNDGAGIDGGAMYVTSLGQLELFSGANITFTDNTGVIGAAVVVDVHQVPPVYSRLAHNPLCTLLYENDTMRPDEWENVSFIFSGNSAIISSGVYLNNLDLCSWIQSKSPWFMPSRVFHWEFVEFSETNQNTAHAPDDFNQEWSVQTSAADIQVTSNVTEAYPGEQFSLEIQVLDEISRPTSDIIRITDLSDNLEVAYLFRPSAITLDEIALASINTSFLSSTSLEYDSTRQLLVETLLGSTSFANTKLQSARCLPGYILTRSSSQQSYKACACNTDNSDILECKGADILLNAGLWATADNSRAGDTIVMYPCPPGYCRCLPAVEGDSTECRFVFRSDQPDSQCHCDRKGELCGDCTGHLGVSVLLNRCTTCSNAKGILIALLMVADAVVFITLLVVMKPFPAWTYPCVFYIQVLPFLTEHFPTTFDQIQHPMYYISSALSFYFIYDFCLYSKMSPLISYFLRYLPLFVAAITTTVTFIVRRRRRTHALPWHGLWWIVLLLYTHVLYTSMSILNCPILPGRDGSHVPRWYVNGNIKCFSGGHIALGLLAILVLGLCVTLIPLSFTYIMGWLRRPWVFRRSFQPLVFPFKKQYKWWACMELSRRLLLVLFIVSFPQNEYSAIFLLMVLIAVYGYFQPFKATAVNILEVVLSVDTIILLLLRRTETIEDALGMSSVVQIQSRNESDTDCVGEVKGITDFTWLLFPLYYLPLLISCAAAVVWIALELKSIIQTKWYPTVVLNQPQYDDMFENTVTATTTSEVVMSLEINADNHPSYELLGSDSMALKESM